MSKPFLLGAGVSAHQTEGGNIMSDWWEFEEGSLVPKGSDASGPAVDHWHRYKEDIDILAEAHLNAFRFSVEWAKIEPVRGRYDQEALQHYRDVLQYCKKKGITTCLTLWHFSLPLWAAKEGGWLSRDVQQHFLHFVETCRDEFQDLVDIWITENEPLVHVYDGYRKAKWPPLRRSRIAMMRALLALAHVHRESYAILHRGKSVREVGVAMSYIHFHTNRRMPWNIRIYAAFRSYLWNHLFFMLTRGTHDMIGVNYYITDRSGSPKPTKTKTDDMGWESHPEGLAHAIRDMSRYGVPIIVTENGIATTDDTLRIDYIREHFDATKRVKDEGIPVNGYFYWSLLDNFEWDKGFSKQFGLIAVDRESMERSPKPSLVALSAMKTVFENKEESQQ